MTTHAIKLDGVAARTPGELETAARLNPASAAFALSAAVTIVFNTLLTWGKEAYPPLNTFMASLTGHHWITHGLANVAVFLALGLLFARLGTADHIGAQRPAFVLIAAVFVSGIGLAGWFIIG